MTPLLFINSRQNRSQFYENTDPPAANKKGNQVSFFNPTNIKVFKHESSPLHLLTYLVQVYDYCKHETFRDELQYFSLFFFCCRLVFFCP